MRYHDQEVDGLLSSFVDGTRCRLVGEAVGPGKKIIDIGCGNGKLLNYIPSPASYTGVDLDPDIVAWLKGKYPKYEFKAARAGADPLPGKDYDTAILAGFIEHLEPQVHAPLLAEARRVMAKGGLLVLTTPTVVGGHIHKFLSRLGLVSKEAAEEHKGFLSKSELARLLTQAGFQVLEHKHYFLGMAHFVTARAV